MASVGLQQAQEHLQMWKTTLGGKGNQTKLAKTSAKEINSIFEKAKASYIEQAKTQSANLHNQSKGTIEESINDATALNADNLEQVKKFIENTDAIAQYEQQIAEKNKEREAIENEIKELQGDVESDSLDQAKEGGSFKEVVVETTEDNSQNKNTQGTDEGNEDGKTEKTTTKKTVKVKTDSPQGNNQNEGKIKELNAKRSKIGDEIIQIRDNDEAKHITENIDIGTKFAENMVGIKTDEAKIQQAKTTEETQMTQIQTNMETGVSAESQKIEMKGQQEQNKQLTNDAAGTKAGVLQAELQAEEAAAQAAKSAPGVGAVASAADTDSAARQQAIRELGQMNKDLSTGMGGAAKFNADNVQLSTTTKTNLTTAMNELKNGQFKNFSEELNRIYSEAMQKSGEFLQVQLPNGQSGESATADLSGDIQGGNTLVSSGNGGKNGDSNGQLGSIISAGLGSIKTGNETIDKAIGMVSQFAGMMG